MKANELMMIGDWVEVINSDHLKYVKVRNILDNSIITEEGENESEEVKLTNIKSIPLTIEIIERNGFKYEYGIGWILDKYGFTMEYGHRPFEEYVDYLFVWCADSIVPLYYVHEQQHALKLCGIEKEIEL